MRLNIKILAPLQAFEILSFSFFNVMSGLIITLDVIIRAVNIALPAKVSSSTLTMNIRICSSRCLSVSRLLLIKYDWQSRYCSLSINHRHSAESVTNYPAYNGSCINDRCWCVPYVCITTYTWIIKAENLRTLHRGKAMSSWILSLIV